MLTHQSVLAQRPDRVVVIGARGFIGKALIQSYQDQGIDTLAIGSNFIDLTRVLSGDQLAMQLRSSDAVVMLSALTPDKGKDRATFFKNLAMIDHVAAAIEKNRVAHMVYISSDAVYPFVTGLVNENSSAQPDDLYGTMHKTREMLLSLACKTAHVPFAILRPTMIYGADDTHNSYGANRFRRQAMKDKKITLGGKGEETRDHLYIDDAVSLIQQVLAHRSIGVLNLATGLSIDFDSLARKVAHLIGQDIEIIHSERTTPITHRHFDITNLYKAFPYFRFTALDDGLKMTQALATAAQ